MAYDAVSALWPGSNEAFFRDREIIAQRQRGPHCVSTGLGMLAGQAPETFQGKR